eukprot:contig_3844_g842
MRRAYYWESMVADVYNFVANCNACAKGKGQVERYNRTIVAQFKAYVSEHQESWDDLVSVLRLAYSSRPQQCTGVAPLEFVVPERVRNLSLERMPATPYPKEVPKTARAAREYHRAHLRNLVHRGVAVPWDHRETGHQFTWERFVDHTYDVEGKLWLLVRWWGYAAEEGTWEPHDGLDERKVAEYCRRVGVSVPPSRAEIRALWGPLQDLCDPDVELEERPVVHHYGGLVEALTLD